MLIHHNSKNILIPNNSKKSLVDFYHANNAET